MNTGKENESSGGLSFQADAQITAERNKYVRKTLSNHQTKLYLNIML